MTTTQCNWIDAARKVVDEHTAATIDPTTGAYLGDAFLYEGHEGHEDGCECKLCELFREAQPGILLDGFTASMLVQVFDALNETNRAKFGGLSLLRAVDVGWKVTSKAKSKP